MALTATEIHQIVNELAPVVIQGWIQKVYQPTPRIVLFDIRTPRRTHRLLISCARESTRLHFTTALFKPPPTPPLFCQFLRAHLQGARITQIQHIHGDRIVELRLIGPKGPYLLVAELTGRRPNLLILDTTNRIQRDLNNTRDSVGQLYVPPTLSQENGSSADGTRFTPRTRAAPFPISETIEAFYRTVESTTDFSSQQTARLRTLNTSITKLRRLLVAWQEDLAKSEHYKAYARYGELIKANLKTIQKGHAKVTVVDYFDEHLPPLTIPLDPRKTPQGNMNDYFRKHHKSLAAEQALRPRIQEGTKRLETLEQERRALAQETWQGPDNSQPIKPTPTLSQTKTKARSHEERRGPFRRFISSDALTIYVGKNARENDALTFGLAHSDDLWLHAQGTPGSHVVIRLEKGATVPPETLRDAATLALFYSDLRKNGKGDIVYTRRKWVKKTKGQALGAVTVSQEKSLFVTLDKARLARLKDRSEGTR